METKPIVLFHSSSQCSGCRKSATLTTDGISGTAMTDDGYYEITQLERHDEEILGRCPRPVTRAGVECTEWIAWDLTSDQSWTGATSDLLETFEWATEMEIF